MTFIMPVARLRFRLHFGRQRRCNGLFGGLGCPLSTSTTASAPGLGRPSTPMARCIQVVEETDDDDDETGLEAYGGAGPNSRKR